ncbi:MAG TPA: enoyl-CoA hydratase-related protein [Candidatus Thermoplasmatota archaeon]|nr:enoyl-CoA hydratase-related protein [Candidatus Thermoplasmatota archaeon]
MTQVRVVTVLGAGDMGHGIAELAATKGFDVRLRDVSPEALERARGAIRASLDRLAARGRLTREAADAALARVRFTTDAAEALGEADLVVEAVPERLDVKQRALAEAEALAPRAVLATNTSAIRIREIAAGLRDPSRLVGMHFFNPVLLMDLVEVVPGPASSRGAVTTVEETARRLGKTVVTLRKDTPGFVTSRLVGVWIGAAALARERKLGTTDEIDAAMRHAGFPMGPFELADYTGLDVTLHAGDYVASRLGEAYRPGDALRDLVEKGLLGRKTGRGFHAWRDGRRVGDAAAEGRAFDPALVMAPVANEAAKLAEQDVAPARDIDLAMRHGCAFPQGPLEWADAVGLDRVLKTLYLLEERTGHPLARPYEWLVELVEAGKLGRATGHGFYDHARAAGRPAAEDAHETILVEVDEKTRVATVALHRPHRLHALDATMLRELEEALARLEEDARVRVVLLTGSGDKAFCAGADLQALGDLTPARAADLSRAGHRLCLAIEKLGKPVVAAINGHALGGGLELALAADFRLAARRAAFALPEVSLGLLPAMGGTQRLPRLVGLARAKEIALLGDRFDAQQALAWGVVHRVMENETFLDEARAFAARLATRAPLALRKTKQLLNAAPTMDLLAGMEAEAAAFGLLASTQDKEEGIAAALARRPPVFEGR